MSNTPPERYPKPHNADDFKTDSKEQRNFKEIAALLSSKLTHQEMYELVLAIEDSDFHAAVIRYWQNMEHPEPRFES
jgi:hypothetical protein